MLSIRGATVNDAPLLRTMIPALAQFDHEPEFMKIIEAEFRNRWRPALLTDEALQKRAGTL